MLHVKWCAKIISLCVIPLTVSVQVFLDIGDRFKAYTHYYTNHARATQLLLSLQEDPAVLAKLLSCQMLLGHQLPLQDYLLKPVQRLLKYPLLLQVRCALAASGHASGNQQMAFSPCFSSSYLCASVCLSVSLSLTFSPFFSLAPDRAARPY
jgi:hypothetical protein